MRIPQSTVHRWSRPEGSGSRPPARFGWGMLLALVGWLMRLGLVEAAVRGPGLETGRAPLPNIVLIYADDLGWGDLGCYGARGVRTPHVDRLAREGLRFTDAHATSATCTPSRYSLLTGEYAWRRRGTGVLTGDAGLVIEPGRETVAGLLREAGYRTGVVGKWHLGLGLGPGKTDWNSEIRPGAGDVGFDYAFLMPATGDRVPCVYVENDRVLGLDPKDPIRVSFTGPVDQGPTGRAHPERLRVRPSHGHDMTIVNGVSRIGYMSGGAAALWKDEEMADEFTRRAVRFIEGQGDQPFFLYFATHDIHVPRVPHPRFRGASTMGPRGDAIAEFDWCVGEILRALERRGVDRQTLVILTSDNGAVVDDGYQDEAVARLGRHRPNGPWRGGKYSKFEGGTRVPLLVRWPGMVRRGTSRALVSQIDLLASLARLVGRPVQRATAPDTQDQLAAWLGQDTRGRAWLVEHAAGLGLREGVWKFIAPAAGPRFNEPTQTELGNDPGPQLYHLGEDPGERENLAARFPERAAQMQTTLARIRRGMPDPGRWVPK